MPERGILKALASRLTSVIALCQAYNNRLIPRIIQQWYSLPMDVISLSDSDVFKVKVAQLA